jgi:hypothetical protein
MCNVRQDIIAFEWDIVKETRAYRCLFEYVMKMNNLSEYATQRAQLQPGPRRGTGDLFRTSNARHHGSILLGL